MRRPGPAVAYVGLSVAASFANALIFTVATVYYVRVAEMGPFQLVFVGTLMEIAIFAFQLPTGAIADLYGRKAAIVIGTALAGVGGAAIAWATGVVGVAAGLVVWGIGESFVTGAREAWVASEAGEAAAAAAFLRAGQLRPVGGMVGAALAAWIGGWSLRATFLVGGAALVALAAVMAAVLREAPRERAVEAAVPHARGGGPGALREIVASAAAAVVSQPALRGLAVVFALAGAGSEGWDRLWQARLLQGTPGHVPSVAWIGGVVVAGQVLTVAAFSALRRPLERAQRPAGSARALALLYGASSVATLVFATAVGVTLSGAAVLVRSVAMALAGPLQDAWLVRATEERTRATALSLAGQADAFGQWFGGPAIGALGSLLSLRAAMTAVAVFAAAAVPVIGRAAAGEAGSSAQPQME